MPYSSEHSVRLFDPDTFDKDSFRRRNAHYGAGIDAIFAKRAGMDTTVLQSLRFDASRFKIQDVKDWLHDRNLEPIEIEEAEGTEKLTKFFEVSEDFFMALGIYKTAANGFKDVFDCIRVEKEKTWKPPESVAKVAARALEWRREYGRGGTSVGISRARDLKNRKDLPLSTIMRMYSFFSRHEKTSKGAEGFNTGEEGFPSNGRIAWDLWGGDPGQTWAKGIRDSAERVKKNYSVRKFVKTLLILSNMVEKGGLKEEGLKLKNGIFDIDFALCQIPDDFDLPDDQDTKEEHLAVLKVESEREQRTAFGIVLEPETVDADKEVYSAEEICKAAWRFMEKYRQIGIQHEEMTDKVSILESYISQVDMDIEGQKVKKGTWLMRVRINDQELWEKTKSGQITGFSIGGFAKKQRNKVDKKESFGFDISGSIFDF